MCKVLVRFDSVNKNRLTHFMSQVFFYTSGFLMFLGGIERYQWHEMVNTGFKHSQGNCLEIIHLIRAQNFLQN